MGRRYTAVDDQNCGSSLSTVIANVAATTVKPRVYEWIFGTAGTPADNAMVYTVQRHSAIGTGDTLTEQPLDPDDPAALSACTGNHSGEPTYTANLMLLVVALNQRATFRWVAPPRGEMTLAASATAGVGLQTIHTSYTGLYNGQLFWEE